jgi:hypothetical protein
MAIGRLYDYQMCVSPPMLPHKPSPDGLALLQNADVEAIWRRGDGFSDSASGAFV